MSLIPLQLLLLAVSCYAFSPSPIASQRPRGIFISLNNLRPRQVTPDNVDNFVVNIQNLLADSELVESSLSVNDDLSVDAAKYASSAASTGSDTSVMLAAAGIAVLGVIGGIFAFGKMNSDEKSDNDKDNNIHEQQQEVTFSDSSSNEVITVSDDGDEVLTVSDDGDNDDYYKDRIIDDLTEDEDAVLEAYEKNDKGLLRASLSKLAGLVRSTRVDLNRAEEDLKVVSEEMLNLEDKYELGQNSLIRKDSELRKNRTTLRETQAFLSTTAESLRQVKEERDLIQDKLGITSESLSKLEEERRSIRKLGRVAWNLSRDKIRKRYQGLKERFTNDNDIE